MKKREAVIGGEGNGGIIYPPLHYGRDALLGAALFLSHLARSKMKASELRSLYSDYYMRKEKVMLPEGVSPDTLLNQLEAEAPAEASIDRRDGLKLDFDQGWVHLRKSNTEPILRVYTEGESLNIAQELADTFIEKINALASAAAGN
jgi:phosphomannomutase